MRQGYVGTVVYRLGGELHSTYARTVASSWRQAETQIAASYSGFPGYALQTLEEDPEWPTSTGPTSD